MVARDGIEPPTPAFSGLDSSRAIVFKINHIGHFSSSRTPFFWDSNGTEEWDNNLAGRTCPPLCISHSKDPEDTAVQTFVSARHISSALAQRRSPNASKP